MPYLFGTEYYYPPSPDDPVERTACLPESQLRDLVLGTLGAAMLDGEAVTCGPDFTELIAAVGLKGRFTPDQAQADGPVPMGDRWQGRFTSITGESYRTHIYVNYPSGTAQKISALFRRGREAKGLLGVRMFSD